MSREEIERLANLASYPVGAHKSQFEKWCIECAAALRQLLSERELRPIESAPKDGSQILALSDGEDGRPLRAIVSWGCAKHGMKSDCDEARCEKEWLGSLGLKYGRSFHSWCPLPPPPETEE